MKIKQGGAWKTTGLYIKTSGRWHRIDQLSGLAPNGLYQKVNGVWKRSIEPFSTADDYYLKGAKVVDDSLDDGRMIVIKKHALDTVRTNPSGYGIDIIKACHLEPHQISTVLRTRNPYLFHGQVSSVEVTFYNHNTHALENTTLFPYSTQTSESLNLSGINTSSANVFKTTNFNVGGFEGLTHLYIVTSNLAPATVPTTGIQTTLNKIVVKETYDGKTISTVLYQADKTS